MSALRPDYVTENERLFQIVSKCAVDYILPYNLYYVFHNYDENVLTSLDIGKLKLKENKMTPTDLARELLGVLKSYKGWYPCLLKVLRDQNVKLSHVADNIEKEVGKQDFNPLSADLLQDDSCEGELKRNSSLPADLLQDDSYEDQALENERKGSTQLLEENKKLKDIISAKSNELAQKTAEVNSLSEKLKGQQQEMQDLKRCINEKDKEIHDLRKAIEKNEEDICLKTAIINSQTEQTKEEERNSNTQNKAMENFQMLQSKLTLPSSSDLASVVTSGATNKVFPASPSLPRDIIDAMDELVKCSNSFSYLETNECATKLLKYIGDAKNECNRSAIANYLVARNYAETVLFLYSQRETFMDEKNKPVINVMFAIWSYLASCSGPFTKSLTDNGALKVIMFYLSLKDYQKATDRSTQKAVLFLVIILYKMAISIGPSSRFTEYQTVEILKVYISGQQKGIKRFSVLTLACLLEKDQKQHFRVDPEVIQDILHSICKSTSQDTFLPASELLFGLVQLTFNQDNAQEIIRKGALKDFTSILQTGKPLYHLNTTMCLINLAQHSCIQRTVQDFPGLLPALKCLLTGTDKPYLKKLVKDAISVIEKE